MELTGGLVSENVDLPDASRGWWISSGRRRQESDPEELGAHPLSTSATSEMAR
jgi:hypothetical protein